MSDYMGQPPHGGVKITHHELCLGDCGHWDCMGCCYCPDEVDVGVVKSLTSTTDVEWLGWWFSDQIEQAKLAERERILDGVLTYFAVAPKAAEPILRIIEEKP